MNICTNILVFFYCYNNTEIEKYPMSEAKLDIASEWKRDFFFQSKWILIEIMHETISAHLKCSWLH